MMLLLFCTFISVPHLIAAHPPGAEVAEQILAQSQKKGTAQYALCVWQEGDKKPWCSYRSAQPMTPASVTKLFSTATALIKLGPEYQYVTKVYQKGTLSGGVFKGDLVVLGSGDPSIASRKFKKDAHRLGKLIKSVVQAYGIKKIVGNVVVDGSRFCAEGYNPTWQKGDYGKYYAAPTYGFNIFDNHVDLTLNTGAVGTTPTIASTYPADTGIEWDNQIRTTRKGGGIRGTGNSLTNRRTLTGALAPNRKGYTMATDIPDPASVGVHYILNALADCGVDISQCTGQRTYEPVNLKGAVLLGEYLSHTLKQICRATNVYSINPFAEALLRSAALADSPDCVSTQEGIEAVRAQWLKKAGIAPAQLVLYDGSGLSRSDRISAEALCRLLIYMSELPTAASAAFFESLPRVGHEGTVRNLFKGTARQMYFKSGSMTGIQSYAGYIYYRDKWHAFAFISNNVKNKGAMKSALGKVIETLFPLG